MALRSTKNKMLVVFFIFGESEAYGFHVPTFRNIQFYLRRWRSLRPPMTPPMKMELTGCFETSAHKTQTPGIHPRGLIQQSEHSESLKSGTKCFILRTLRSISYSVKTVGRRNRYNRECVMGNVT
jgi:hypothetical protein